jgi:heptosyltransferase-2
MTNSTTAPANILVRGVNWLGDAVMTTPALQRLRERFPRAQITLLTHQKLKDLWGNHPSFDRLLIFAAEENPWSIARRLRPEHFDLALVLPNSPRSALETWLARIPQRVGYARPGLNWLLTQRVPRRAGHIEMHKRSTREIKSLIASHTENAKGNAPPAADSSSVQHHLYQYLHLTTALGANPLALSPLLTITSEEVEVVRSRFLSEINPRHPILALNPGAEYGPAKRWPLERFVTAAREVQQRTNCTWLLLGGPLDVPLASQIHSALSSMPREERGLSSSPHPRSVLLAGQTTLRELMGLLKLSRVLVTNDSGPMHVAGALGTPVVAPFGSTSPGLTAPGLPGEKRHRILTANAPCSPCFLRSCPIDFRCMTGIGVEQVVKSVLGVLDA